MNSQLIFEFSKINVRIETNNKNSLFSDYVLTHKERIIGNGWKWKNENKILGFVGWAAPALNGELCWTKNKDSLSHEEFDDVINLFQFAISDDFYWFSPPTNRQNFGFSCNALTNPARFIEDIQLYINNDYNHEIFLSKNYKWDWPERD